MTPVNPRKLRRPSAAEVHAAGGTVDLVERQELLLREKRRREKERNRKERATETQSHRNQFLGKTNSP
jgi:hypothetical protein